MKAYGYVYRTKNSETGRAYIGQHKSKKLNSNYLGSGKLITRSIKKYGKNIFKLEVLAFARSKKEIDQIEKEYIALHRVLMGKYEVYNVSDGGEGRLGKHPRKCTCATCKAHRGEMFGKNNPNYGKRHNGKNCNCCVCRNIRRENTGKKNYGFGKPSPKRGKTYEELYGKKKAEELKNLHRELLKNNPIHSHTSICKCACCNAKRGGNSGKNNPMYGRKHKRRCMCASCLQKKKVCK